MQGYGAEMNRSARRKMLRVVGIIMVVMLPVMLALWFAQLRAVTETSSQLRTFAQLALDKTELVIEQVDLARNAAEKYQGERCTPEHRQYMLNVVRGRLYVADLIYADGQRFLCSTVSTPDQPYLIPTPNYTRKPDVSIYYFRDTPFFAGYKMTYMQRRNYVVVVNPLSYSEVMSTDHSLVWGVYDTVTNAFFSVSPQADISLLHSLLGNAEHAFQSNGRFYTSVNSTKRPIAAIVSTSNTRFYDVLYHQATLTLPLGMICSIIILLVWSRTHREFNSPGRLLHRALR